jgi:glycosyltransferase involved in cell wall biosynthesis
MIAIDSYRVSGPAKGLLDFCESARGRVDPTIVVFQRGRSETTEFRKECERRGVPVAVVWEHHRYDISAVLRALRVAWSLRPDLVQSHGYKADFVALAVRSRLGVPWVAFSHGRTDEGPKMRLYQMLDAVTIRRADRIVAVSEARRVALQARGCASERLVTIHNGVEMPGVKPVDVGEVRRELGLREDRPTIAVVGRLSPEKGQRDFVDAMALIASIVPPVQALIVGDGPEEGRLRAQVAALGLRAAIRFTGYRPEMDRIYAAIDLLVLPSLSEGLPNVVLEAMAHGQPVVATRVGGVPEVIEDGTSGVLVEPGAARALAGAVVTLLRNPGLRAAMGRAARERVERSFSVGARAKRILAMYGEVLQRRGLATKHGTAAASEARI